MKKFNLRAVLFTALVGIGISALAQIPKHPNYIKEGGKTEKFYDLYKAWTPGQPYSVTEADDDEFFISRVKPKERFTNAQTQVNQSMDPARKLLWWVPIGEGNHGWNAKPAYYFDSEAFNMWNYIDKYGNWTAAYIRCPAAFLDAAHKNGVLTSVNANVGWAASVSATDKGHGQNFQALIDGKAEKMLQFCRYYGVDGIGLNSEFNFSDPAQSIAFNGLLKDASAQKDAANWPSFGSVWYNLMTNAGRVGGSSTVLNDGNKDWFYKGGDVNKYFFLNYGWETSALQSSEAKANELGRDSYDVYAGMDMQASSPQSWSALKDRKISIGIWGAHNMNMLYETRAEKGSDPLVQQNTYMARSEGFFTGATRNPANTPDISSNFGYTLDALKSFHGISKFITARSVLQGDLATNPFVTYFNLGNGTFFNINGVTANAGEWYNIGIQDYLPTWRWWLSASFMGNDVVDGLKANFTWNDAWFGGSCLEVSGETSSEFLHLFKTKYPMQDGDKVTVRYKLLSGNASLKLAGSVEGDDKTAIIPRSSLLKTSDAADDVWVEKTISVGSGIRDFNVGGKTLAMLALQINDASADFKILIGEVKIARSESVTPDIPLVKKNKLLALNHKGFDFKLIYAMNSTISDPATPVYNDDVKTWYYKVYSQQEGESVEFCTATTSWAAYMVAAAHNKAGSNKVRLGVSAVSLDGNSESDIAWGEYMELPTPTIEEGIVVSKNIIKPEEDFEVRFLDFYHPAAKKWEIRSQVTGNIIVTEENVKEFTAKITAIGIYDVIVTLADDSKKEYKALIQISPQEVGALPEIKTLTANGSADPVTITVNDAVNFAYTGRKADGVVSRGIDLKEQPFILPVSTLGLNDGEDFSLAFWFKSRNFKPLATGTALMNIKDPTAGWPQNNWGMTMGYVDGRTEQPNWFRTHIGNYYGDATMSGYSTTIEPNIWFHVVYVYDYQSDGGLTFSAYVNGKQVLTSAMGSNISSLSRNTNITIGCPSADLAGLDGIIDEVQYYSKAINAEEVKTSMAHIEAADIPDALKGYWDFESDVDPTTKNFANSGKDATCVAYYGVPIPGTNEGEVTGFTKEDPNYIPGAPFIPGSVYKVTTTAEWKLGEGGALVSSSGSDEAGVAEVKYSTTGDKVATLTLTNGWGSATKTFSYVRVEDTSTAIDDMATEMDFEAYPNPFKDEVNVQFSKEGDYTVDVYNLLGQHIYSQLVSVTNDQFVRINVNAPKGTFLLRILKDNKTVKVIKVIKK
ncbi:endo-beta-N-acetylglucosaminidase [Saccharicrinis sp. GN24d3]|uniref:endo-beta-N-acetylglucosaminidase n=1 Tax=Saccharicrinis sp. GN24d3 TaxID=3458416 RepID=UPI00403669D5